MDDKFSYMNTLLSFYGELLTEKQLEIMVDYYYENLSLSEIAENREISRNGVYDTIKKSENILLHYEEVLKLNEKYEYRMSQYQKLLQINNEEVNAITNELINEEDV